MAMGIVNDLDFDDELLSFNIELDDSSNQSANVEIKIVDKGRGLGSVEVPNSLRNIIGETSVESGRSEAIELANHFGISPSSVSAYANGSKSTTSYAEQPNLQHINSARLRIQSRARNKLKSALNNITDEKLAASKAIELSGVARNMAAIIKDMEPEVPTESDGTKSGPTFVFYSPQMVKEETFDAIYVKE